MWTGTPMRFIRLAGCNVGKPAPTSGAMVQLGPQRRSPEYLSNTHPQHTICTGWDGRQFLCDTNYQVQSTQTIEQIFKDVKMEHVCITGGEPFIHDLSPLVEYAQQLGIYVHIETSGTREFKLSPKVKRDMLWITCAPKLGVLQDALHVSAIDEVKLVIYPDTPASHILDFYNEFIKLFEAWEETPPFFLQPITNNVDELDRSSMDRCVELVLEYPWLRVSLQTHKIWGVR